MLREFIIYNHNPKSSADDLMLHPFNPLFHSPRISGHRMLACLTFQPASDDRLRSCFG